MVSAYSALTLLARLTMIVGVAGVMSGCSSVGSNRLAYQGSNVITHGNAPPAAAFEPAEADSTDGTSILADDTAMLDDIRDPLEPLSRVSHQFNRGLDRVVLRPVAKVYGAVVPDPAKRVVHNFVTHWDLPGEAVSYAIQGDDDQANKTMGRFLVNTIVGVGGLFDPASNNPELEHRPTDFGVALASLGMREGIYFEAPVLGPSNTRRSVGRIFERLLNPISYVSLIDGTEIVEVVGQGLTRYELAAQSLGAVTLLDTRSQNDDLIEATLYASPDTYSTLRSVYIQRRRAEVSGTSIESVETGTGLDDDPLYLPIIE